MTATYTDGDIPERGRFYDFGFPATGDTVVEDDRDINIKRLSCPTQCQTKPWSTSCSLRIPASISGSVPMRRGSQVRGTSLEDSSGQPARLKRSRWSWFSPSRAPPKDTKPNAEKYEHSDDDPKATLERVVKFVYGDGFLNAGTGECPSMSSYGVCGSPRRGCVRFDGKASRRCGGTRRAKPNTCTTNSGHWNTLQW